MSPSSFFSELILNAMHCVGNQSYSRPFLFDSLFYCSFFFILSRMQITQTWFTRSFADQKLDDPSGIYSLQTVLASLVAQSQQITFFTTTLGDGQNEIMGLYQCRGDISNTACFNCVSKIPDMLDSLCGKVVAARVQLIGCYLSYEVADFKKMSETQLLYKVCGSKKESYDYGFEERRDYAFCMMQNGVRSGGNLFYVNRYQPLCVLGQCEGDLAKDDCRDCVKSAEDQAKAECGDSISGQIYLHISYSFDPRGVSPMSSSPGSPGQDYTKKIVAITVGVLMVLGLLIVCVLVLKSMWRKKM